MIVDIDRLLRSLGIAAKKKGHEWEALCPYHEDRKPSWSIRDQPGNDRHGKFNCFSCHAGGDAIQLTADMLQVERDEAELWLAESGITELPDIPFETGIELTGGELSKVCAGPNLLNFAPLPMWVSSARDYATSRGITAEQVERWGIGYAVSGRVGGRIWIPIRDSAGTLLSWTARSYTGSRLRYLTATREESVRLDAIFGEHHWDLNFDQVVLTEGALNALACERAGAKNVAALNGSNVTALNIAALSMFGKIVIATDPDKAGERAAGVVISALKRWKEVVVIGFPPGKDASDLPEAELSRILAGA